MSERLFLFGALLSPSYLHPIVPDAIFLGTGVIAGWRLEFDELAFIAPQDGGRVFGAVYSVEDSALKKLARVADPRCRLDVLSVRTEHGTTSCHAFVAEDDLYARLPGETPSERYLDLMESGYQAHNASEEDWNGLRDANRRAIRAKRLREDRLAAAEDATWD